MTLPDLDDLIADVDRTCAGSGPIERLKAAAELSTRLQVLADDLVTEFVESARFNSQPWAEIGAALGVSRQAAQQRFVAPHVGYSADEFTEELRDAMPMIKRVAIQHRHNYIGTEHLLLGVLAEPNDATRLVESLGASVAGLRAWVEPKLTLGASQAAERIAWTPLARKSMALAKKASVDHAAPAIGCDHLVIGMARLGRGMAAKALAEAGITAASIKKAQLTK